MCRIRFVALKLGLVDSTMKRQWLIKDFSSLRSDFHYRVTLVSDVVPPKDHSHPVTL